MKLRRKKLKVLGYANDLMIVAEEEEDMRWLIKRLEMYWIGKIGVKCGEDEEG